MDIQHSVFFFGPGFSDCLHVTLGAMAWMTWLDTTWLLFSLLYNNNLFSWLDVYKGLEWSRKSRPTAEVH